MTTEPLIQDALEIMANSFCKTFNVPIFAMNVFINDYNRLMGDAKAVKSSTEQAQSGIAPEAAGLEPECVQPSPANNQSEISVVDEDAMLRDLSEVVANGWDYGEHPRNKARIILDAIRPYLRQPMPVSVNLEKCAEAVRKLNLDSLAAPHVIAKAVLDAAEVQYAP